LFKEWLTNRGKEANKNRRQSFQTLEYDKAKRNNGFEDQAGTKLAIETTSSKPLGLKVDKTAKPNQTSLALCLRFLSPWHYHEMFTKGRFYTENF